MYNRSHKLALRRISLKQKNELIKMRGAQRTEQKDVEDKAEDTESQRPSYCMLCRLNYRQPKSVHQASDAHKKMKKFLMPYCSPCRTGFKSPMAYETHRCSIEHIRKQIRIEKFSKDPDDLQPAEIDLQNFTTQEKHGLCRGWSGEFISGRRE